MTTCHEAGEEAAVAVLTQQPVSSRIATHLESCPDCGRDWERLSRLPQLLAAVRDAELAPRVEAGPDLLDRLLAEAARSRRRRRIGAIAAAAAVIALAVPIGLWVDARDAGPGGTAVTVVPSSTPTSRPPSPVLAEGSATEAATGAHAYVEVRSTEWGSDVAVAARGLTPGTVCQIVVVDRSGHRETAGSWTVSGGYRPGAAVHETVHTPPEEIARVELVDEASGQRLLAVPVA